MLSGKQLFLPCIETKTVAMQNYNSLRDRFISLYKPLKEVHMRFMNIKLKNLTIQCTHILTDTFIALYACSVGGVRHYSNNNFVGVVNIIECVSIDNMSLLMRLRSR